MSQPNLLQKKNCKSSIEPFFLSKKKKRNGQHQNIPSVCAVGDIPLLSLPLMSLALSSKVSSWEIVRVHHTHAHRVKFLSVTMDTAILGYTENPTPYPCTYKPSVTIK